MTAPRLDAVAFHKFEPGLAVVTKPDTMGRSRTRIRCRRCGSFSNAPHHRSPERLAAAAATYRAGMAARWAARRRPYFDVVDGEVVPTEQTPEDAPPVDYGPDGHAFAPGGEPAVLVDKRGQERLRATCKECGAYANAPRHRSVESRLTGEAHRRATLAERYGAPEVLTDEERRERKNRSARELKRAKPRPERPAVEFHEYEFGGEVVVDKQGKHRPLCRCGAPRNAPRHRDPDRIAAASEKVSATMAARRGDPARPPGWFSVVDRLVGAAPDVLPPEVIEAADQAIGKERRPKNAARAERAAAQREADRHEFVAGETKPYGPAGRLYPLCAVCDRPQNAPRHRSDESRLRTSRAISAAAGRRAIGAKYDRIVAGAVRATDPGRADQGGPHPTPIQTPTRVHRERISVPAAELAALALAIDGVLALPVDRVPWKLRLRLGEARPLIDIPTFPSLASTAFEEPIPDAPSETILDALPQLRPVERSPVALQSASALIRGIRNDRMRNLARRAISTGWQPAMTGSGHLALTRGQRRLVISTTSSGAGRGWQNLRADAKRLGIDVSGL